MNATLKILEALKYSCYSYKNKCNTYFYYIIMIVCESLWFVVMINTLKKPVKKNKSLDPILFF